jgi:hypothetical protein
VIQFVSSNIHAVNSSLFRFPNLLLAVPTRVQTEGSISNTQDALIIQPA